jgi:hypothetical protein
MRISNGQYIPPLHRGTNEQIIQALIEEAADVHFSGTMRQHAKDRELQRINLQLRDLGVDLILGDKEDEGFILGVREHETDCYLSGKNPEEPGRCSCKSYPYKSTKRI